MNPGETAEEYRLRDFNPTAWTERLEALAAFAVLISVDLVTRLAGFGRLHRLVARWPLSKRKVTPLKISRICQAVDRAASYYFKRAWCLQRSAVTTLLLRRAGSPAQMVIAVQRIPFRAHAWVEVGGEVVNDAPEVQKRYVEIERL